jgi:hypothetical protein
MIHIDTSESGFRMIVKLDQTSITKEIVKYLLCVISMILFGLLASGCAQVDEDSSNAYWQLNDLRAYDPVDTEVSHMDIIAVYVKDIDEILSIRLDLLEMDPLDQQEIYIGIDYKPSGTGFYGFGENQVIYSDMQWDIALEILASGNISAYNSQGDLLSSVKARIFRDTTLDTITINLNKQNFIPEGAPMVMEVLMLDQFTGQVLDRTDLVNSKALPPGPARVVLGFYNSFKPYTPAQALRMWDGAHTGPMSGRHGLGNLIEAAVNAGLYINIWDLCSPVSVVGLDYLGVYSYVLRSVDCVGLDVVCGYSDKKNEDIMGVHGYANNSPINTDEGLTLELREQIVDAAITGTYSYAVSDLANSVLGNPLVATNVFHYINGHPWIKLMKLSDLDTTNKNRCIRDQNFLPSIDTSIYNSFIRQYISTPDNIIKELAEQTYASTTFPANPQTGSLVEHYFGQLGHILSAAVWAEDPVMISRCDINLDWDVQNECVLSSEKFYLTFEMTGGYLDFAFYNGSNGIHQITAPMSEVMVGLGDPSSYDGSNGAYADPALIPGVLAAINESNLSFDYRTGVDFIELYNETAGIQKVFRISESSIEIGWFSSVDLGYIIPISLDPWQRFKFDWSDQYFTYKTNNSWVYGIEDQITILIQSSSDGQFATFLDSKEYVDKPEDPNFDYPQGHYLPFPFATLHLSPTKNAVIKVSIIDP